MSKPYDILIPKVYIDSNGEERTTYYRCGVAFENSKGGMSLEIVPNMTITGAHRSGIDLARQDRADDEEG